jgi:hypothetical protein
VAHRAALEKLNKTDKLAALAFDEAHLSTNSGWYEFVETRVHSHLGSVFAEHTCKSLVL